MTPSRVTKVCTISFLIACVLSIGPRLEVRHRTMPRPGDHRSRPAGTGHGDRRGADLTAAGGHQLGQVGTPFGGGDEQGPAVGAAEHAGEAAPVEPDGLADLSAVGDPYAAPAGHG